MGTRMRRTPALIAVLEELLHSDGPVHGFAVMQATGLAGGTV
jgi:hypothetical protein